MRKILLVLTLVFANQWSFAESKATDLVGKRVAPAPERHSLKELMKLDENQIPDVPNSEIVRTIERVELQTALMQATNKRNTELRLAETMYGMDQLIGVSIQSSAETDSVGTGLDFFGNSEVPRGLGNNQGFVNEPASIPRYASFESFFSINGRATAKVRWDPIRTTVKNGETLPGGFKVLEVRRDELVVEKEGMIIVLTQEPVSIDDLLEVVAANRKAMK
jgi:hypothetical protein